jgi:ubiquitin C-terminal hydrolase
MIYSFCKPAPGEIVGEDGLLYELYGLNIHKGSLEMGHYIAYVKRYGDWYCFDDEDFRKTREQEALDQEAYLLFYRRVEEQL